MVGLMDILANYSMAQKGKAGSGGTFKKKIQNQPSVLFVVFLDRISRHSCREKDVWFGNSKVALLPFADDLVLLASNYDPQHALE